MYLGFIYYDLMLVFISFHFTVECGHSRYEDTFKSFLMCSDIYFILSVFKYTVINDLFMFIFRLCVNVLIIQDQVKFSHNFK